MNKKTFVVFGGSGFVGSHLVKELLLLGGVEVIIADIRQPSGHLASGVTFRHCDVRERIPDDLADSPSVVVNLAAVHRTPGHPDHEYFDTNVNGARNVVAYCEKSGVKNLWFTSSISVYGPSEEPKSEETVPTPESAYGKSKFEAEEIHRAWAQQDPERRLRIVRPAVIFGAGECGNFTKLAKAMRRGFFIYPGRNDTIKACGYVEDLVGSLFFMDLQAENYVLYNYCYPHRYTIRDICETFGRVAKYRRPLLTLPLYPMVKIAQGFQFLNSIGVKNGIHPQRIYKLIRSTNIIPGELIRRQYPYRTDLEEGLRRWKSTAPGRAPYFQ